MKIKLFESFEMDLDISYELYIIDKNGDEEEFGLEEDASPNDLSAIFEYYKEQKKYFKTLFIKKVTKEILDDKNVEALLNSKKYNI